MDLSATIERAQALLKDERLDEAERAVIEALSIDPRDLRARNLRGLILLKAGRHEEAHAVFSELERAYPGDPALRSNLALCELRMGRFAEAAQNLERVVEVEPQNQRAQGFLGLALMRMGQLERAKLALDRARQPELVRQVAEQIAKLAEAQRERPKDELKRAAAEAGRVLESDQPFEVAAEEVSPDDIRGEWELKEPGEGLPRAITAVDQAGPPLLADFLHERALRPNQLGEPFQLTAGGVLVIRIDGSLPTRTWGAIASTGQLKFEPLERRVRGEPSGETFGASADSLLWGRGHGLVMVAPRGGHFQPLRLEDDVLYIVESALFSFDERLDWESGRVPGDPRLAVVQFRGAGQVVLKTTRPLHTISVQADSTLFVERDALKAWSGHVVPRLLTGPEGQAAPYVECSGEGAVLVEEPAS